MQFEALFSDKTLKAKAKTTMIAQVLLDQSVTTNTLLAFARTAKDAEKATCIEAIEYATQKQPNIADEQCWHFLCQALTETAPRVKWEAARAIGNIAHLYPAQLDAAIDYLLTNAEHTGTVVRWSAAHALSEIVKLKTGHNADLLPAIEALCSNEEDNAIKKKYLAAIKKVKGK